MTSTYAERFDELRKMTGSPARLAAVCTVDQRYAQVQHERLDYRHPRGGEALYLQRPLMENFRSYIEDYAKTVLSDGGHPALRRAAEHLSDQVEMRAPILDGDLRRSGHPQVTQDGKVIMDRPPKQARLTDAELRAKSRRELRRRWNAGEDVFWTWHGHVIHVPAGGRRRAW